MLRMYDVPIIAARSYAGASLTVVSLRGEDLPAMGALAPRNKANAHGVESFRRKQSADVTTTYHEGVNWFGGMRVPREEAVIVLRDGWPEGAARIAQLRGALVRTVHAPASVKRALAWRNDGEDLDLDKYLRGDTEDMYRSAHRRRVGRGLQTVTLGVALGGNATVSADEMFFQGAAAAALLDMLDDAGYLVELHAVNYVAQHHITKTARTVPGDTYTDVIVKEAGEHVRPDVLAAVLAHAGVFRTFGFDCLAAAASGNVNGSGLGTMRTDYVLPAQQHMTHHSAGALPTLDLMVPVCSDAASATRAIDYVLDWLAGDVQDDSAA